MLMQKLTAKISFLALIVSLLPSSATAQDSPDFSKADALIRSYISSGVPSIAIAVTLHGKIIWEKAVGMANQSDRMPATTHTPYYLASVSKTMTATALMELIQEGKIDLDRPVNNYLGAAKLSSQAWNPEDATILKIATHTAGLATYDWNCLKDDPKCSTDTNELIRRYGVIVWKPGDHFDYSNADYGILGEVVAHSSRERLSEVMKKKVFLPLGMHDCFLDSSLLNMSTAAVRYDSSHPSVPMPTQRSTTPGASSMYCSVHDLALFGMFHLKDHVGIKRRPLSDRSIDEMQRPIVPVEDGGSYGFGWWVQNNLNGYHGVLAQGGTKDATAYLQLIPSEDISVAMLWNSGAPDGSKVIDEILATMLPRYRDALTHNSSSMVNALPVPAKAAKSFLGTWAGSIHTYRGDVPLTLVIDPSGSGSAKLGSEPEVHVSRFRFDGNVVKCELPGISGLGDTGPDPYSIDVKLYLHGDALVGAARTATRPPSRDSSLLFYSAILRKSQITTDRSPAER